MIEATELYSSKHYERADKNLKQAYYVNYILSSSVVTLYLYCCSLTSSFLSTMIIREGFKKSKWKFKMAFAMKGGLGGK